MRENKKILINGSLIGSIGFIIEFIMELLNVVTLMSFIVFRESLGMESPFNGLVNELCEGSRVLTQNHGY